MHRILPIVFIPLLLLGCETAANIDRGLYQVSDNVAAHDRVTGDRTINLTPRPEQIKKANAAAAGLLQKYDASGEKRDAELDPQLYARINAVFSRILPVSHMRDERWTVVLLKNDEFNAFTIGGTYIFVYTGLFSGIQSDDELAAVMGHELAHVSANHVFEKLTAAQIGALRVKGSEKKQGRTAAFTIAQEQEADRIGILYAALAGFDPYAASRVWARLYQKSGNGHEGYNDHPVNGEREAQTRAVADKVKGYYRPGQQNPNFAALLENNTLWKKKKDVAAGKGGGLFAALDAVAHTYEVNTNARLEQQRQQQTMQKLAALRQQTTVAGVSVAGANTLRVWLDYRGPSLAVKDSVYTATIADPNGQIRSYRAIRPGWVHQNTRFFVDFTNPALNASVAARENVQFAVADIDP